MAVRLGTICRQQREHGGLRQIDIAALADVRHTTISHFEDGRLVRSVDRIVAAYAHATGTTPETLWLAALNVSGRLPRLEDFAED